MDRYFIYKHFMDWHMDKHIFHFQFFFVEIIDFTILLISGGVSVNSPLHPYFCIRLYIKLIDTLKQNIFEQRYFLWTFLKGNR